MTELRTKIPFGKIDGYRNGKNSCAVEVQLRLSETKNGPEFAASVNLYNSKGSDLIMGGQCLDKIADLSKRLQEDPLYQTILDLWKAYHLNALRAGTPEQTLMVEEGRKAGITKYGDICEFLKEKGLYEVPHPNKPGKMYAYGTEWIYYPIFIPDLANIRSIIEDGKVLEPEDYEFLIDYTKEQPDFVNSDLYKSCADLKKPFSEFLSEVQSFKEAEEDLER